MKRLVASIIFLINTIISLAQGTQTYEHTGEFGISGGFAHYFGDLNPDINFSRPKGSTALHYTKQFNDYVGIKFTASYAFLAYADKYSKNPIQQLRNLSFNSDIYEFSINGTFNFFAFNPAFSETSFTPYVGIGLGIFSYDPYALYKEQKYYLRPLGTEGQESEEYPNRKKYDNNALCIPLTLGVKYAITQHFNIFSEIRYRFTNTDYLDDVSKTYTPSAFANGSDGELFSDRSRELGFVIGQEGRQRGNSLANDSYATFHLGISFNFSAYRCPNLRKMR